MINCYPISTCARNIVRLSGCVQRQMSSHICSLVSQGPSSSFSFYFYTGHSKPKNTFMSVSETFSCSSITAFHTFQGSCFYSGLSKRRGSSRSLTVKSLIGSRGPSKRSLNISLTCQNMNVRLLVPKQGVLPKIKCNVGSVSWPQGCASAGLMFALLVCYSSSEPVHAESAQKKEDKKGECYTNSHGKKVYTDYSITGIPGDGRCLFRSVVHGACLRSGKPAPSASCQRELADELRAEVVDEFIRRRSETEWTNKSDIHMKSGLWSVAVPMEYMTSVLFRKEADSDPISTDGKILAD
ncbi:OVARIAN TUMOR DOMAIN-containing deubiquitinating enzyme 4 isoform X3 [Vitis vinifera]|uniref:OVARIAN TUMOR DOMAIN-containing deubiquitinating enzyme 4 isoform X3 n=1 Tax=Vitis vinifera TaxID=29760 RepID=UPI002883096E|nr:OVARIAN TUMOR DOMAIN-containing deubiquitinating enzyme 4 isoform X3 [Vitis vinifera]